jgi:hypothetical protein
MRPGSGSEQGLQVRRHHPLHALVLRLTPELISIHPRGKSISIVAARFCLHLCGLNECPLARIKQISMIG